MWFATERSAGSALSVRVSTPCSLEEATFSPSLAVMGPSSAGFSPSLLDLGRGDILNVSEPFGLKLYRSQRTRPWRYEPLTPMCLSDAIHLDFETNESGTFFFIIFNLEDNLTTFTLTEAHVALQLGPDLTFSGGDLITYPSLVWSAHRWQRTPVGALFAPLFSTLLVMIGAFWYFPLFYGKPPRTLSGILLATGGCFYIGFAVFQFVHMCIAAKASPGSEVGFTILIWLSHIAYSIAPFIIAVNDCERHRFDWWKRALLILLAITSLFDFGAGVWFGPILVLVGSLLPSKVLLDSFPEVAFCPLPRFRSKVDYDDEAPAPAPSHQPRVVERKSSKTLKSAPPATPLSQEEIDAKNNAISRRPQGFRPSRERKQTTMDDVMAVLEDPARYAQGGRAAMFKEPVKPASSVSVSESGEGSGA